MIQSKSCFSALVATLVHENPCTSFFSKKFFYFFKKQ